MECDENEVLRYWTEVKPAPVPEVPQIPEPSDAFWYSSIYLIILVKHYSEDKSK